MHKYNLHEQKNYSWGTAKLTTVSNGTRVRFILQKRNIKQDVDSLSGLTELPIVTCFMQVAPKSNVTLRIQRHSEHRVRTEEINAADVSSLTRLAVQNSLSTAPLVKVNGYRWFRGKRLAQLNITPYIYSSQNLQEIDTIEVIMQYTAPLAANSSLPNAAGDQQFQSIYNSLLLNTNDAASASVEPLQWSDSTGTWLPLNSRAIKLTIPTDGVYRLTYTDLITLVPELFQVDPVTFRLFNKGKELPMTVKTGNAGTFSVGDYLEFIGLRNYNGTSYRNIPSGGEEYTEYLNRYTDTSFYWLTWGERFGSRYISDDIIDQPIDTLRWYTEILHLEQNNIYDYIGRDQLEQQNPMWTVGDLWGWSWLFANQEFDAQFRSDSRYTANPTARVYIKVANAAANLGVTPVSVLKVDINSYAIDTTSLNQFQQKIIQLDVPLSHLTSGNNTIHIYSLPTASSTNSVILDWIDVEYPRDLTTSTDSLWFEFSDLTGIKLRKVIIQGLTTTDCIIYKAQSNPKKISKYTISGNVPYSISFIDTIGNGDRYVLLSSSKVQTPVMNYHNNFANLRDNARKADYLLITNFSSSGFSSLANSYAKFVHQTYGLDTTVIDVHDIYDEFGYGYPVPESMREFLKATTRWFAPMPSYVFLVGRANYDFKNYRKTASGGTVPNIVPVYGMPVTDPWIATLDDSLFVPQMYVGRLPALSEEEFQRYYQHVQIYCSAPYDDWNKRYMFFAGGGNENEISLFHYANQQIIQNIVKPAPVGGVAIDFYKTLIPLSDYGPYTQEQFNNAVDSGAVLIAYIGHSGTQTWDNNIADITKLQNTRGRYSLISDFGCSTAKFAEPDIRAFGELFTLDANGSAVGYIGNSSLGFTNIALTLPQYFYRTILLDSIHTLGMAHLLAKTQTMTALGGPQSSYGRQLMLTNTLIGDPAVELAIPTKPNLSIAGNAISSTPDFPSDDNDSLLLRIPYYNFGSVPQNSFQVSIHHSYFTSKNDTTVTRQLPLFIDTLAVSYPIRNLPGTHDFTIQLNPLHTLNEISYFDNSAGYSNIVQSIAFRIVYPVSGFRSPITKIVLMNPIKQSGNTEVHVVFEIDTNSSFTNPSHYQVPMGQVVTKSLLPQLVSRQYYWRAYSNDQSDTVGGSFFPLMIH